MSCMSHMWIAMLDFVEQNETNIYVDKDLLNNFQTSDMFIKKM